MLAIKPACTFQKTVSDNIEEAVFIVYPARHSGARCDVGIIALSVGWPRIPANAGTAAVILALSGKM